MDRRIEVVISNLEARPTKSWETSELADLVNLSSSRLRHLFKQETGTTPAQYLKTIRLRRAATLLRTTFMSIKEIAMSVGLTTASYFVREFRKSYGMTPTEFRNSAARHGAKDYKRAK
ncbi:MAG TPA: helix-turn-helix transcriptional regulator [Pyrinomonadaceae bacterium]|nr:helix-turn-helix transcriptional regulator [Pyrinomonadaceae bacterium]